MERKPIKTTTEDVIKYIEDVGMKVVPLTEEDIKERETFAGDIYMLSGGEDYDKCEKLARKLFFLGYGIRRKKNAIYLPLEVGDVVWSNKFYFYKRENGEPLPYQITNITITQNKKGEWTKKYRAMELRGDKTIDSQLNFSFDEIGKTVFNSKEEYIAHKMGEEVTTDVCTE